METEVMAECLSCGSKFTYKELTPDDSPVATCPECGKHRFKGDKR